MRETSYNEGLKAIRNAVDDDVIEMSFPDYERTPISYSLLNAVADSKAQRVNVKPTNRDVALLCKTLRMYASRNAAIMPLFKISKSSDAACITCLDRKAGIESSNARRISSLVAFAEARSAKMRQSLDGMAPASSILDD